MRHKENLLKGGLRRSRVIHCDDKETSSSVSDSEVGLKENEGKTDVDGENGRNYENRR